MSTQKMIQTRKSTIGKSAVKMTIAKMYLRESNKFFTMTQLQLESMGMDRKDAKILARESVRKFMKTLVNS